MKKTTSLNLNGLPATVPLAAWIFLWALLAIALQGDVLASDARIAGSAPAIAELAPLNLTSPLDYQVFQRQPSGEGAVRLSGRMPEKVDRLEARFAGKSRGKALANEWQAVAFSRNDGSFEACVLLPEGGWFTAEIRVFCDTRILGLATVAHVGVGEVFLVAGQSNSSNHGSVRQQTASGLVAAFDGDHWQPANDPQPGASGDGGSFIPAFGDAVALKLGVPVGVASIGAGGTSVREWLPGGERMTNQPTTGAHVKSTGPHEWESTGELFNKLASRLSAFGSQGFRAILWHQGESDAGQARSGYPADRQITGEQYRAFMERLIQASRLHSRWTIPWFVAQATYHSEQDPADEEFRAAQSALWKKGIAWEGPDTDSLREGYRDGVHFNALGLRRHSELWAEKVVAWISLPRAARLGEVMSERGDYTFLWWSDGWLKGLPRKPAWVCLQTGHYGAIFDPWHATLTRLGKLETTLSYDEASAGDRRAIDQLPVAQLNLSVSAGGAVYRCVRAATNTTDSLNFPVRIIESGRFLQRWDILQLVFADSEGRPLPAEGRLEIIAWPDRLNFLMEIIPQADMGEATLSLDLQSEAFGKPVTNTLALQGRAGSVLRASLAAPMGPEASTPPVQLTATNIATSASLPVEIDRDSYRIALPKSQWTVAQEPDRLERYRIVLDNPADQPQVARLVFDAADGTPGITGVTPMLRDADGHPTGIPVQISKNWHRQEKRRLLYEGPWLHGITMVRLPPRSSIPLEFALCWARWGGVPAASHAQLCLIGWSWNQLWDEVAIGSWGESICYEPDGIQVRCRIDDVRPLMVWAMNSERQPWSWTHNVGGGDFLVYYNEKNEYQPWQGVRTAYLSQGPNLTDVLYSGTTADGAIACQVRVSTPRCDDINRAYHRLRYDVLKPVRFQRLAFYQLGSDNYHWHQYDQIARGNAGGLVEEWSPGRGGSRYLRSGIPCEGDAPWFSLHAAIPQDHLKPVQGAWASRGLIVRSWAARLGGREAPPTAAVFGTEAGGIPSANLELVPPTNITQLLPGDFVEAEVEMTILPCSDDDYYGPNRNLKSSLAGAGNTWRPVLRQAAGNRLELTMRSGRVLRNYPPVFEVDSNETMDVEIKGGCGYVPLTLTGLKHYRGYELIAFGETGSKPINQSVHGNDFWQTGWDAAIRRWRQTYNICLDTPGDAPHSRRFLFRKQQ